MTASVSIRKCCGLMQTFNGLRLRIGRQVPPFLGTRKKDERNRGSHSVSLVLTMAPLRRRLTSSPSSASLCPGSEGIGVTLPPPVLRRWIGELQLIPLGNHPNHPPVRAESLPFPSEKAQSPPHH